MISLDPSRLRFAAALLATLIVGGFLLPGTARAATGTDLAFGYTWRDAADGAVAENVPFTAAVTRITPTMNNPPPSGPVATGFAGGFPFYGTFYPQMWISDNGWVSFTAPANSFPIPSGIPNAGGPAAMLAALWKDLVIVSPAGRISHEYVVSRGVYRVQWTGLDENTQPFSLDVLLYPDGRIKFQYAAATAVGMATVGIENGAQNDGCQIAAGGTTVPGVGFTAGNVIEFLPPPILPPLCGTFPAGGCRVINGSSPVGPGPNVLYYCLGTTQYAAREAVYSFTVAEPSTVQIDLTAATALRAFVLTGCNERQCIRGAGTSHTLSLWPGTYQVAVDGPTAADQGAFVLSIVCTPIGVPLNCGSMASGTTAGGPSRWTTYPCAGATDLSGPESVYTLPVAAATNLTVNLDFAGVALDVAVMRPGVGEITPADCIAWGDTRAVAWNVQPGNLLVIVDGRAGASGAFTISTTCAVAANCTPPAGILDMGMSRTQTVLGDTSAGSANIGTYACDPTLAFDGRESIYEVVLPTAGQIAVYDPTGLSPHSWFIMSACNEGACVGSAGEPACAKWLDAGTYYISVDSAVGDEGPFEMLVVFDESFNRWDVCEGPSGATLLTDESSPFWNFDDGAFCHTEPTSRNFPNGCIFAMYATVRCGTAMHLPFYDTEGGHIRIFDVLNGQYVFLTARSGGGWFQQGTDIDWSLIDCSGSDPRWNEVVTDVFFERPAGLCGVFRLEFPNHSGFVWELYANCAGDRAPQFNIHDSLCAALADYEPLPNITIVSATVNANCPNVTVNYTLRNDGCLAVTNFPITLYDGAVEVQTHLVPRIDAASTVMGSFMATFPMTPTGLVTLVVDPLDQVVECTEVPGASCDAAAGTESVQLPGCAGQCQVIAQATATPARICAGSSTMIDAGASSATLCPGGALEYQLRGPTGTVPWQASPIFAGIAPGMSGSYTVDVRCADPAVRDVCVASRDVQVDVDRRPDLDPMTVVGFDLAACNPGIRLNWTAATFYSQLGTGAYNIYRSTVSCADAVMLAPLVTGLTLTTYSDVATVPEGTYYYVIEAEDSTTNSTCLPRGPRNGGAVTRVDVSMGTCLSITDAVTPRADLLPRIGPSLRVGGTTGGLRDYGETFVQLQWTGSRPLSIPADEHFHVLRSATPDAGFVLYSTEPPRLQQLLFLDLAADDPSMNAQTPQVWHYLVYSADACENENQQFDDLP